MWPFLALLLGPPLVPVWVAGWVALARRPEWRPRPLPRRGLPGPAPPVCAGRRTGLLPLRSPGRAVRGRLRAGGRCPGAGRAPVVGPGRRGGRAERPGVRRGRAAPGAAGRLWAPARCPGLNQLARDQVGWPTYVRQVAAVYDALPERDRRRAVVVTSNYGEAGALARYGPPLRLPEVYSGHNALYDAARPPDTATIAIVVGGAAGVGAQRVRLVHGHGQAGQPRRRWTTRSRGSRSRCAVTPLRHGGRSGRGSGTWTESSVAPCRRRGVSRARANHPDRLTLMRGPG